MDTIVKKIRYTIKEKPFLPDELVTNILIKLPPKSVMRCRLVCRRWRDLTSARDFVDLNLRNSFPTILVAKFLYYSGLELTALDEWWELAKPNFPFYSGKFSMNSRPLFSHAGLIALKEETDSFSKEKNFIIINPARGEHVRIVISKELYKSKIYGVYYQPSMKEYCLLLKWYKGRRVRYTILNLGSNPSLRRIRNPFRNRVEKEDANPLFIKNCLYWMLEPEREFIHRGRNDIMEFDIISEEFVIIPCPVPLNTQCSHYQTHLLSVDGILSFLLVFSSKITIWRLKDRELKLWTIDEYNLSIGICGGICEKSTPIAVVDGMLAHESDGRLLVCNLKEGTVKNSPKRDRDCAWFFAHQLSLASLKKCKSTISIDKDWRVGGV